MSTRSIEIRYTRSMEEYIKAIYILSKRKRVVRVKDIALLLNVKPPSVTASLNRLLKMGLIEYEKRGYANLTPRGKKIAKKLMKKYNRIREFLINILGIQEDIADIEACSMEHFLHEETINKISKLIEFIENCPQGPKFLIHFKEYIKSGKYPKECYSTK